MNPLSEPRPAALNRGTRVEVRDLVFASPHAGDAACVIGYGAEIVMSRVGFRHAGDEAAIYVDGGLLDLRDALIDARTLPTGTMLETDLAIIGGGPAGISLALSLAHSKMRVLLLESGGMNFDPTIQKMYSGTETGTRYAPLDAGRLRQLGGGTPEGAC